MFGSREGRWRASRGKCRLLHTPLDVASTSDLFAKPPVLTGIFTVMNLPGLPEEVSYPLSLPAGKKLTADEIGHKQAAGQARQGNVALHPETLAGNGPYGASLCPRLSRRGRLICFLKRDSCGPAGGSRRALLVGKAGNEQRFYHQGAAHTVHTGTTAESARQGSRHRRLLCRMNCPLMGCCGFVEKASIEQGLPA